VAEARGFIAGASRIMIALDDVPGGVIPKAAPATRNAARPARRWSTGRWVTGIAAALMLAIGVTTWNRRGVEEQATLRVSNAPAPAQVLMDTSVVSSTTEGTQAKTAPTAAASPRVAEAPANQAAPREQLQSRPNVATGAGRAARKTSREPAPVDELRKESAADAATVVATPPSAANRAEFAAAEPETLAVAEYAGCYRSPETVQLSDVVVTAAPGAASAREDATRLSRRAASASSGAPAAAPAPAPVVAPAPPVELPAKDRSYPVLGMLGRVWLDTLRDAGEVTGGQRRYREIGRWTPLGRDSARVVMRGQVHILPRSARQSCP